MKFNDYLTEISGSHTNEIKIGFNPEIFSLLQSNSSIYNEIKRLKYEASLCCNELFYFIVKERLIEQISKNNILRFKSFLQIN